jgi:Omp85 superfamily domain
VRHCNWSFIRHILRALTLLPVLLLPASAETTLHWLPPRLNVGETTIVGKASYSSDNDLGVGFELLRPFRFPGSSPTEPDAEIRLDGRVTQNGHVRASARGTVHFDGGDWVLRSRIRFENLYRRFWGIGGDTPSEDEELFRPHNTFLYVEVIGRVAEHLRVGLRGEYQDYRYAEVESGGLLDTMAYVGLERDNVLGGGLVVDYDTRDDRYEPRHGIYAQAFALFFADDVGSDFTFNNYNIDIRGFVPLGESQVLALQAFGWTAEGNAPIWRFAELGGRSHSRGYRHARYIDKSLAATQIEWRVPLQWRVSGALFGGVAVVGPRASALRADLLRPTTGVGLRWKLFEDRDVVLRADVAFGQDSARAFMTFGQAF